MDADAFAEAVLSLVERVPPGRVTTYGALADAVGSLPRGPVAIRHAPGMPVILTPEEGSVFMDRRAAIMTMRV